MVQACDGCMKCLWLSTFGSTLCWLLECTSCFMNVFLALIQLLLRLCCPQSTLFNPLYGVHWMKDCPFGESDATLFAFARIWDCLSLSGQNPFGAGLPFATVYPLLTFFFRLLMMTLRLCGLIGVRKGAFQFLGFVQMDLLASGPGRFCSLVQKGKLFCKCERPQMLGLLSSSRRTMSIVRVSGMVELTSNGWWTFHNLCPFSQGLGWKCSRPCCVLPSFFWNQWMASNLALSILWRPLQCKAFQFSLNVCLRSILLAIANFKKLWLALIFHFHQCPIFPAMGWIVPVLEKYCSIFARFFDTLTRFRKKICKTIHQVPAFFQLASKWWTLNSSILSAGK